MKANEVLKLLNITRPTLCTYIKKGYIKATKTPTGVYNYDEDSVLAFVGLKKSRKNTKIISYTRVSTQGQKSQLTEQTNRVYNYCISKGIDLTEQITDIKSGMSFDRKGFQQLCMEVIQGRVQLVIIENKDRLVRFGYEIVEGLFKYFGTTILVINDEVSNKTYEQELTEDFISIIHYFTAKSYSHRRKLNKLKRELESEEQ